ncbi:alpha-D-ribose 1-methylphosphonate 5-triphosphate diphosphatase [Pseudofrankia inefficax]|uniref:Phosphonate metabolism protein PhnM n=1 Tax=Pseudofrankia inefficax (strain DSM 45817 / CECT 9037 / DDB 130130 / EuI1c) TaxID=298654 RepID=E3J0E0_PSEI1|nr:alpha-D-ribose 1-methylphosphonate 5-triphosphate diphosphatase [Pseudofrankia inefficax]ADP81569.1 phosphonate metabolism protein PhnM [Pseudofrankia inefficax]
MTRDTVLSNARIVLPDEVLHGSVLIRDGRIADIGSDPAAPGEDLDGDHLLPGVVELHTDHLEYHFSPRPGVRWDALPAVLASDAQLAAGGATTVLDAVRVGAGTSGSRDVAARTARQLADSIELAAEAGLLRAEHALHVRCEVSAEDCLDAFGAFVDDPYVRLVSLMDHTPGQRQYADLEVFKRFHVGKGLIAESEFDAFVGPLVERSARYSDVHRREIARLAAQRGIPMATHDDATSDHVAESVALGGRISEFPTTVLAAAEAAKHGQQIVMGAPNIVRGGSQSGNVAAAELLELGLLHMLSSDYVPSSPLQAVFQLAADGVIGLPEGAALVSGNPARSVGLDDRGEITVGRRADLVRVRSHDLPGDERHPRGLRVPVVREVYREGVRVS